MSPKVALIVGAGGVLGDALAREFSMHGYRVIGVRRPSSNASPHAFFEIVTCDLQDSDEVRRVTASIVAEQGQIDILICNTAQFAVAPFAELTLADFEGAWRSIVGTAIGSAQATIPTMIRQSSSAIIFTGATASVRGGARFAAFAAAKFALRGVAQSLAREYQSLGVHVIHVVIDGLLAGSPSQTRFGAHTNACIEPDQVAKTYRWLAEQEASSWTHELDIRPSSEKF